MDRQYDDPPAWVFRVIAGGIAMIEKVFTVLFIGVMVGVGGLMVLSYIGSAILQPH